MKTTATGIEIRVCGQCGREHPVTRTHCQGCGVASAFQAGGYCLKCRAVAS